MTSVDVLQEPRRGRGAMRPRFASNAKFECALPSVVCSNMSGVRLCALCLNPLAVRSKFAEHKSVTDQNEEGGRLNEGYEL